MDRLFILNAIHALSGRTNHYVVMQIVTTVNAGVGFGFSRVMSMIKQNSTAACPYNRGFIFMSLGT